MMRFYQSAMGNQVVAARMLQELNRAVADDDSNRFAVLPLANYQMYTKNWSQAIISLKILLQINPTSVRTLVKLGKAYQSLGNLSEANQAFANAKALDPNLVIK